MEKLDFVTKREVIELFVSRTIFDIQKTKEIPKINFIFDQSGLALIESVKKRPFKKEGYYIPDISDKDYQLLLDQNKISDECYNIVVHDADTFFTLLTEVVNEQVKLEYQYHGFNNARYEALYMLRRIWLRMDTTDFYSVENFLMKQRDFIKNRELDDYSKSKKLTQYDGIDVYYKIHSHETYYETSRVINLYLYDGIERHDLANVLYDIREENNERVCYIYAVQMPKLPQKSKKMERIIYKINSLSNDGKSNVHPNFSLSLLLFIELIKSHGIEHIKVPLYQVLSYDYHVLLSNKEKEDFDHKWTNKRFEEMERLKNSKYPLDKRQYESLLEEYKYEKEWYDHVVDKEDFISKAKTEGLANLFIFLESINALSINSIPLDDTTYLDVSLSDEDKLKR